MNNISINQIVYFPIYKNGDKEYAFIIKGKIISIDNSKYVVEDIETGKRYDLFKYKNDKTYLFDTKRECLKYVMHRYENNIMQLEEELNHIKQVIKNVKTQQYLTIIYN